jgi:hypothetical protein
MSYNLDVVPKSDGLRRKDRRCNAQGGVPRVSAQEDAASRVRNSPSLFIARKT